MNLSKRLRGGYISEARTGKFDYVNDVVSKLQAVVKEGSGGSYWYNDGYASGVQSVYAMLNGKILYWADSVENVLSPDDTFNSLREAVQAEMNSFVEADDSSTAADWYNGIEDVGKYEVEAEPDDFDSKKAYLRYIQLFNNGKPIGKGWGKEAASRASNEASKRTRSDKRYALEDRAGKALASLIPTNGRNWGDLPSVKEIERIAAAAKNIVAKIHPEMFAKISFGVRYNTTMSNSPGAIFIRSDKLLVEIPEHFAEPANSIASAYAGIVNGIKAEYAPVIKQNPDFTFTAKVFGVFSSNYALSKANIPIQDEAIKESWKIGNEGLSTNNIVDLIADTLVLDSKKFS